MKDLKKQLIINISILILLIIAVISFAIFLNFYLDKKIHNDINKQTLIDNTKKSFELLNENMNNKIKYASLLTKNNQLAVNEREVNKQSLFILNSFNGSLNDLYFMQNTPYYKIIQNNGNTDFFYKDEMGFKFENNQLSFFYKPIKIFTVKKRVELVSQLSQQEQKQLIQVTSKIFEKVKNNLNSYINDINDLFKDNGNLNYTSLVLKINADINTSKNETINQIQEFKVDLQLNMLLLFKTMILSILGFLIVILIVIIRQLLDSYNKNDIMISLLNNDLTLNETVLDRNKKLITIVNDFYKNKKDDHKDIILESIKASK